MTRFARAQGTHQRTEDEATSWKDLKPPTQLPKKVKSSSGTNSSDNNEPSTSQSKDNETLNKSGEKSSKPNRKRKQNVDDGVTDVKINLKKRNTKKIRGPDANNPVAFDNDKKTTDDPILQSTSSSTREEQRERLNRFNPVDGDDEPRAPFNGNPRGFKRNGNFRGIGETRQVKIFGQFWVAAEDGKRLQRLLQQMKDKGMSRKEIMIALQNERRNAEKSARRKIDKTCLFCRQFGHMLANCPSRQQDGVDDGMDSIVSRDKGDGICFKCGSVEHSSRTCNRKGEKFSFATCFVCKKKGHIARQCPENSKGIYPTGGCCNECGKVTHLRKDCPELAYKTNSTKSSNDEPATGRVANPFTSTEYEEVPDESSASHNKPKKRLVKF